ncbi:MAG: GcrA family cell cycle regulator [Alphaproteobacteria bacterium]
MSDNTSGRGCLWPMWPHSSVPNHEYCGKQKKDGQSYCAEHYARSVRTSEEQKQVFVPRRLAA